jgi:DNA polymerase-3 subunit delta'
LVNGFHVLQNDRFRGAKVGRYLRFTLDSPLQIPLQKLPEWGLWLDQATHSERVAHAQMLVCEDGGMAWPLAMDYVGRLLCGTPSVRGACGSCPSCIQLKNMAHPDVHWIVPVIGGEGRGDDEDTCAPFLADVRSFLGNNPHPLSSEWIEHLGGKQKVVQISVKESARIQRLLSLKAHSGGHKVVVLWMPERLNDSAANKLLKLIEEPLDRTILLLISHDEASVLGTIRSRCQVHYVKPVPTRVLSEALVNQGISLEQAAVLSELSGGQPGQASMLLRNRDALREPLQHFVEFMRITYKKDLVGLLAFSERLAKEPREQQKQWVHVSAQLLSQLLRLRHGALKNSLFAWFPDVAFQPDGLARLLDESKHSEIQGLLQSALTDIQRNINSRIVLSDLGIQFMRLFAARK